MKEFDLFLMKLSARDSSREVYNQYKDERVLNNLKCYLSFLLKGENFGPLIIGEAPGYKGCRITGIPFTSTKQIQSSPHHIFLSVKKELHFAEESGESTATIIWEKLKADGDFPVFWNSFPFHPHKLDNGKSNRRPNDREVLEGKEYLELLIKVINPRKVYALGRVAENSLKVNFPSLETIYIRHPSNGGKSDFLEGVKREKLKSWII